MTLSLPISAYVLAGGRSSRMGADKALLQLGGRPLVELATAKLSRLTSDVSLLAGEAPGNPALAAYGRRVFDLYPGAGPVGGIQAALSDARQDWILVYPVDVPMMPVAVLARWAASVLDEARKAPVRIAMFEDQEQSQPALLMLHRETMDSVQESILLGERKLFWVLRRAAAAIGFRSGALPGQILRIDPVSRFLEDADSAEERWPALSGEQKSDWRFWFSNLNTPEDFEWAQNHLELLDA